MKPTIVLSFLLVITSGYAKIIHGTGEYFQHCISVFNIAYVRYPHIHTLRCKIFNFIDITDDNFESEVLYADVLVLVEFWAEWSGSCKMLSPVLEEVNDHFSGKLKIVKMNIDESEGTYPRFGVRAIATMFFF